MHHQTSDICVPAAPARDTVPDEIVSVGGLRLAVRPIGPGDRHRLAELFERLSPESRYQRFLSPKPQLAARELTYLTEIDHVTHEALGAIDPRDGSLVGVGRYAADPRRPAVAHIAVAVADELHGVGIGTALARRTVERARTNGYTLLIATTLWENRRARALVRRLGFRAVGSHGSVIELVLEADRADAGTQAGHR